MCMYGCTHAHARARAHTHKHTHTHTHRYIYIDHDECMHTNRVVPGDVACATTAGV